MKSIKEMIDTISHKGDKMTITLHNGWEYCFFADDRIPYCDLHMYGILHNVEFYDDYEVVYQLIKASYKVITSNLLGLTFGDKREILTTNRKNSMILSSTNTQAGQGRLTFTNC